MKCMCSAPQNKPSSALNPADLADYHHPVDVEQFRRLGYQTVDMICDYFNQVEQYKVKPDASIKPGYLRPLLPQEAPQQPESWDDITADFRDKILPGMTHWQSPNFFAYFPANTSFPGILAEMLIGTFNMIGFSWQSAPVATELEHVMMDWLAAACGLPPQFLFSSGRGGGVIQGTSSEALLVAMLSARAQALSTGSSQQADGVLKLVCYGSDQAHSSYQKAAMIAGIRHVRTLPTTADHDWSLQPDVLEAAVQQDLADGLIPFYVCATIGTTSSCAVDPIEQLGVITQRHKLWLHVDAAHAGSAAICPEHRHHFQGLHLTDSYSFNPHKWLLTTWDCCAMWLTDTQYLKEALSLTPVFLRGRGNDFDYKDWQIPLGRRFRALKLWMILRMYGVTNLQQMIRHHMALADWFATAVTADERFELAAPPRFGLVCFRLKGVDNAVNKALLEAVNESGDIFMIHTELAGQYTLRFAIGQSNTQMRHVQAAWQLIQSAADNVLSSSSGDSSQQQQPVVQQAANAGRSKQML
eukprot:jgi/Chrzof1/1208/Cz01g44220.t1